MKKMKKLINPIICLILFASVFNLIGCEKKDKLSKQNKEKIEKLTPLEDKKNTLNLSLYFDTSENPDKVELAQEERLMDINELLGELTLNELIKGPSVNSKLYPILPKETRLMSFSVENGIAYVNFSKDILVKMSPKKEVACLKSIVWSLTALPNIEKVKFLVENKDIKSLGGNFDISKPIGKVDFENAKNK
ncbi:conserved protein [Clostridium tetani E88]|uniref:Conserved protein n=2 Tax=Clostridium tetani TaxID=1513 RepID=Q899K6_CLOTE|nr:conserved protein [Clostridium tetani E88]